MNAYDFDKTIVPFDSTALFTRWCLARYRRARLRLPMLILPGLAMLLRLGSKERFKEALFRAVLTAPADLRAEVDAFWQENLPRTNAWYLEKRRPDDVVISASPDFLVRPALERLGVTAVIATRLDPSTGRIEGRNCHGAEKVARFRQEWGGASIEEFYSDSLSDSPMARLAKRAYLVKGETLVPWPAEPARP